MISWNLEMNITSNRPASIPIHERVELPDELIPADSRVEIDAKITAGGLDDLQTDDDCY